MRAEGNSIPMRDSRSERSTQTEEVANPQIPMLSEREMEELSTLELLQLLHTTSVEIMNLMAMEWLLTSLTILLPSIPFFGMIWSRFWLTTFNVDWAVCWVLIGVAPLLMNSLRRSGGPHAWDGPSGQWIYMIAVFGILILFSVAPDRSQAPGLYARMISSSPLHFW